MLIPRFVVGMFSISLVGLIGGVVSGQNYPNKPIRIVTSEVGGGNDITARLIASGISGPLGQQVIVDNRGSAASGEIVAKASPDGYTLLLEGSSFWIGPLLRKTSYDPVRDFSPITMSTTAPNILVVQPSLSVNSIGELLVLAKAKPGELNYATSGTGSSNHLAAELFKSMAGVNITRINYKGSGQALNALIGGETQLMFATATSVISHVKSKRLKALAISTPQPSALFPGLPTVAASGLPGYEAESRGGSMFAPAGTAAAIIKRLNREVVRVLNQTDVKERFFSAGVEVVGNSPEQAGAMIKAEMARMRKLINDAGIRGDNPPLPYDEALGLPEEGIAAVRHSEGVPHSWTCPACSAAKSDFEKGEV